MSVLVNGCAPAHEIPVHEEYIRAGVQAGDTIEVTTRDGTRRRLIVTAVGPGSIETADERISFDAIEKIVKRSWTEPEHPCGGAEPVGCSIPSLLMLGSDVEEFAEEMEPACVAHDFCYRHGYATYRANQAECDKAFYRDMAVACAGPLGLAILDFNRFVACEAAAATIYETVRHYGKNGFHRDESTYCEYDLARDPAPRGVESHVVGGFLEDGPVGPGAKAEH